jgi:hypothetical protein
VKVQGDFSGPFAIRWSRQGSSTQHIAIIDHILVGITAQGTQAEAYALLEKTVREFFPNRGIVLTPEMGYADAIYWVGQFLFLVGRNAGLKLHVRAVRGYDEHQRQHVATGFTQPSAVLVWDGVSETRLDLAEGVKLIEI